MKNFLKALSFISGCLQMSISILTGSFSSLIKCIDKLKEIYDFLYLDYFKANNQDLDHIENRPVETVIKTTMMMMIILLQSL